MALLMALEFSIGMDTKRIKGKNIFKLTGEEKILAKE